MQGEARSEPQIDRDADGPVAKDGRKLVTRCRIVAAASIEFAAHGFVGATVRSVAKRAGVSPSAVYWHFGTKPALFAEAVRLAGEQFVDHFANQGAEMSFRETATAWIQHLQGDSRTTRLLRSLAGDHRHAAVRAADETVQDLLEGFWRQWLRQQHRQHLYVSGFDTTAVARAIVATLAGHATITSGNEAGTDLSSVVAIARLINRG